MHGKPKKGFRIAARAWFVLIIAWGGAVGSVAAEECELPSFSGSWVVDRSRSEEFRITLNPPDYGSADAVRRHFIFSTIWGNALVLELRARLQGACEVHIERDIFPDLRAILLGYRSARGQDDFFGAVCVPLLEEIVHQWTPDEAAVAKAVGEMTRGSKWVRGLALSSRSYPFDFTENILRVALARIYDDKSVMHALNSVDVASYLTLTASSFLEWIGRQQSGHLGVARLSLCPPALPRTSTGLPMPVVRKRTPVFPPAIIAQVGAITIPDGDASKDLPGRFHHVVVIGDDRPAATAPFFMTATSPYAMAVAKKYCGQRHTLDVGDNPAQPVLVLVSMQCQYATILDFDHWLLLFCADCRTRRSAEVFAKLVINDPDLRAVKSLETDMRSTGPYLISFSASGQ